MRLQGPRLAVAGLGVVADQPPTRSSPRSSTPSTCAGKELGFRAFLGSGGGIRTRDLRVMSRFRSVRYLRFCRDFVKLDPVT